MKLRPAGCYREFDIDNVAIEQRPSIARKWLGGYMCHLTERDRRPQETLKILVARNIERESRDITRQISDNLRDINRARVAFDKSTMQRPSRPPSSRYVFGRFR